MCGIVGANFRHGSFMSALRLLSDRGPDECGVYETKNTILGHARLSIIGGDDGAQPMSRGELTLVFNGEIYNYKELARDENIDIRSDSEIILFLYQKYGKNFLSRLNGMFAFVIYDKLKDSFFGARDSLGKKPLFYYQSGEKFIFSSRINSILKLLDFMPQPNLNALQTYLSFMSCTKNESFYKDIFKVESGSGFELVGGKFSSFKFEDFSDIKTVDISFEEAKDKSLNLLKDSLNLRLRSDKKVAFLLSGGLDSSMICSLYSQIYGKNFDTFSLGFSEYKRYDETNWAKKVADVLGANHHRVELSKKDFFDTFDIFYDFVDEPLADSATIATHFLSKKIHENGYKVALSGEGGDECFMGYDLYFRVLEFYEKNLSKSNYPCFSKDYEYLRRKEMALPIYGSFGEIFTSYQKEHLLNNISLNEPLKEYQNSYEDLAQMSYLDFKIWISEVLTTKLDRAGMANSLEIRSPFLDDNLVKFTLSLPKKVKFQSTTKKILKQIAYSYLPKEIVERRKKGFSSPFIEWIFEEMGSSVVDRILKVNDFMPLFNAEFVKMLYQKAQNGGFKQHLWSLLHFAIWLEKRYF